MLPVCPLPEASPGLSPSQLGQLHGADGYTCTGPHKALAQDRPEQCRFRHVLPANATTRPAGLQGRGGETRPGEGGDLGVVCVPGGRESWATLATQPTTMPVPAAHVPGRPPSRTHPRPRPLLLADHQMNSRSICLD